MNKHDAEAEESIFDKRIHFLIPVFWQRKIPSVVKVVKDLLARDLTELPKNYLEQDNFPHLKQVSRTTNIYFVQNKNFQ